MDAFANTLTLKDFLDDTKYDDIKTKKINNIFIETLFNVYDVSGNGNCLFNSIAESIICIHPDSQESPLLPYVIRQMVAESYATQIANINEIPHESLKRLVDFIYTFKNQDDSADYIEYLFNAVVIGYNCVWGGQYEIIESVELLNYNIVLLTLNDGITLNDIALYKKQSDDSITTENTLFILYVNKCHYKYARPKPFTKTEIMKEKIDAMKQDEINIIGKTNTKNIQHPLFMTDRELNNKIIEYSKGKKSDIDNAIYLNSLIVEFVEKYGNKLHDNSLDTSSTDYINVEIVINNKIMELEKLQLERKKYVNGSIEKKELNNEIHKLQREITDIFFKDGAGSNNDGNDENDKEFKRITDEINYYEFQIANLDKEMTTNTRTGDVTNILKYKRKYEEKIEELKRDLDKIHIPKQNTTQGGAKLKTRRFKSLYKKSAPYTRRRQT